MFKLNFVSKENELNKLIRAQKRERDDLIILMISLWDDTCTRLMSKLINKYSHINEGRVVHVIDSFTLPHSFVIYNVTQSPALVYINSKDTKVIDYIPSIYEFLDV